MYEFRMNDESVGGLEMRVPAQAVRYAARAPFSPAVLLGEPDGMGSSLVFDPSVEDVFDLSAVFLLR